MKSQTQQKKRDSLTSIIWPGIPGPFLLDRIVGAKYVCILREFGLIAY
jgi:hypothetical protein